MNVGELIRALLQFNPGLQVYLDADPDGLAQLEPLSAQVGKNYNGHHVVLVSAWEYPEGVSEITRLL